MLLCAMIPPIKCFLHVTIDWQLKCVNLWEGQDIWEDSNPPPLYKFFQFKVKKKENPQIWLQRTLWFSSLFTNWMLDVKAYSRNLSTTPCPIAYTIAFRGGRTSMSMNFTRQQSLGDFYFLGLSVEEVFFLIAGLPFVIQWKEEVTY